MQNTWAIAMYTEKYMHAGLITEKKEEEEMNK